MSDSNEGGGVGAAHGVLAALTLVGSCVARLGDDAARVAVRGVDDIGGLSIRAADNVGTIRLRAADDLVPPRTPSADPFRDVEDLASQWSRRHAEETGRLVPRSNAHPATSSRPPNPTYGSEWYERMSYEGAKILSRSNRDRDDE